MSFLKTYLVPGTLLKDLLYCSFPTNPVLQFLCGDRRVFEKISFLNQLRGEGGRGNRKRETRDKRGAKRDEIRVMRDERQETRDEQ